MRTDAAPDNFARILMLQIEAQGFGPFHSKFVVMIAGRNMRMAASHDVGIDAYCGGNSVAAGSDVPRGFVQQNFQLRLRFHIKEQNSTAFRCAVVIANRGANFVTRFADAGEDDALASDSQSLEPLKFAS